MFVIVAFLPRANEPMRPWCDIYALMLSAQRDDRVCRAGVLLVAAMDEADADAIVGPCGSG